MGSNDLSKVLWELKLGTEDLILQEDDGGYATVSTWSGGEGMMDLDTGGHFNSLLDDIITQFNADSTQTYVFEGVASDPFGRDDYRIQMRRTAGTFPFRLVTNNNMLVELGNTSNSTITASGDTITFPLHYNGAWMTPRGYRYRDERERPHQDGKKVRTNGDKIFVAVKNKRRKRRFEFLEIPGELTFKDAIQQGFRHQNINSAELHASFEHFWEEALSVGGEFVVYHDIPPGSEGLDSSAYGWYACVLQEGGCFDMWELLDDALFDYGKEVYNIEMIVKEMAIAHP